MDRLEEALGNFLKADDAAKLSRLLKEAGRTGAVSYEAAQRLLGSDTVDILLLAYQWRLLLPARAARGGDWEDRLMVPRPGEAYEMPNVVRHLVANACQAGRWEPEKAIYRAFQDIEEPDLDKMPVLVERMASEVRGHRISGVQIKKICAGLGLEKRIDPLVSELKACGIISHKLGALTDASREGAPLYEFNPSLLVGE